MSTPTPPVQVEDLFPGFAPYRKFLMAALGSVVVVVVAAFADNQVSTAEAIAIAVAVTAAFATYQLPNADTGPGKYTKFIATLAAAGLTAVGQVVPDGFQAADVVFIATQLLVAGGVLVAPNTPK